jgi:hypothetical protein
VQVLDLANIAEGVVQVFLSCLLVQASNQDDPALNRCVTLWGGSGQRTSLRRRLSSLWGLRVHFAGPLAEPPLVSMLSYLPVSCMVARFPEAVPRPFRRRPASSRAGALKADSRACEVWVSGSISVSSSSNSTSSASSIALLSVAARAQAKFYIWLLSRQGKPANRFDAADRCTRGGPRCTYSYDRAHGATSQPAMTGAAAHTHL